MGDSATPVRRLFVLLTIAIALGATAAPAGQSAPATQRPSFAGTWIPSEPAKSTVLFDNGMGWVPGDGKLVIEHTATRLTVTKHVPDAVLDRLLEIQGRFDLTVIYAIREPRGRAGGAGAAGDLRGQSWRDDQLVVAQSRNGSRVSTVSLALDGDRLRMDTHTVIAAEKKQSLMQEWFTRAK